MIYTRFPDTVLPDHSIPKPTLQSEMCIYEQLLVVHADIDAFDVNIGARSIKCLPVESALLGVGCNFRFCADGGISGWCWRRLASGLRA